MSKMCDLGGVPKPLHTAVCHCFFSVKKNPNFLTHTSYFSNGLQVFTKVGVEEQLMRRATDLKKSLEKVLRKHSELNIDYKSRQRRVVSKCSFFQFHSTSWQYCFRKTKEHKETEICVIYICHFFAYKDFAKRGRHFTAHETDALSCPTGGEVRKKR